MVKRNFVLSSLSLRKYEGVIYFTTCNEKQHCPAGKKSESSKKSIARLYRGNPRLLSATRNLDFPSHEIPLKSNNTRSSVLNLDSRSRSICDFRTVGIKFRSRSSLVLKFSAFHSQGTNDGFICLHLVLFRGTSVLISIGHSLLYRAS